MKQVFLASAFQSRHTFKISFGNSCVGRTSHVIECGLVVRRVCFNGMMPWWPADGGRERARGPASLPLTPPGCLCFTLGADLHSCEKVLAYFSVCILADAMGYHCFQERNTPPLSGFRCSTLHVTASHCPRATSFMSPQG